MNNTGTLFCLSAPSGAGKTSLVKALLPTLNNVCVSISHTTRPMRPGETEGQDYHFVSEAEFQTLVQNQIFLEHATVFGHAYGTSGHWVDKQLAAGIDVILEIDWQGQRDVKQQRSQSVSIFILPPSTQALAERLAERAQDTPQVIEQRLRAAQTEMSHCLEYDYLIINDDFKTALCELQAIIRSQRLCCTHQQSRYQQLINKLLQHQG